MKTVKLTVTADIPETVDDETWRIVLKALVESTAKRGWAITVGKVKVQHNAKQ